MFAWLDTRVLKIIVSSGKTRNPHNLCSILASRSLEDTVVKHGKQSWFSKYIRHECVFYGYFIFLYKYSHIEMGLSMSLPYLSHSKLKRWYLGFSSSLLYFFSYSWIRELLNNKIVRLRIMYFLMLLYYIMTWNHLIQEKNCLKLKMKWYNKQPHWIVLRKYNMIHDSHYNQ